MIPTTNFHTAAYFGSVTNGVANMAIAGVPDQILTLNSGGQFILPRDGRIRAAWVGSANMQRARVNTPSMRYVGLPFLAPVNVGLTIPSPPNVYNPAENGPYIPQADAISIEATQGGGAAENAYAVVVFMFNYTRVPPGPAYRIRATAAIVGAAGVWANGTLTPDSVLPAGTYSVIGLDLQGTNVLAGRLIFPTGSYRPGAIARNTLTGIAHPLFTSGDLGEYGQFDSVNFPNLEIFCGGASAAQEVYLDVVRTGGR